MLLCGLRRQLWSNSRPLCARDQRPPGAHEAEEAAHLQTCQNYPTCSHSLSESHR